MHFRMSSVSVGMFFAEHEFSRIAMMAVTNAKAVPLFLIIVNFMVASITPWSKELFEEQWYLSYNYTTRITAETDHIFSRELLHKHLNHALFLHRNLAETQNQLLLRPMVQRKNVRVCVYVQVSFSICSNLIWSLCLYVCGWVCGCWVGRCDSFSVCVWLFLCECITVSVWVVLQVTGE